MEKKKIQQLERQMTRLKIENDKLKKENVVLKKENWTLNKYINSIEEELELLNKSISDRSR